MSPLISVPVATRVTPPAWPLAFLFHLLTTPLPPLRARPPSRPPGRPARETAAPPSCCAASRSWQPREPAEAQTPPAAPALPRGAENSETPSEAWRDRKSTRLNSSHVAISYAVFCLKKTNLTSQL